MTRSSRAFLIGWIVLLLLCLLYSGKRVVQDKAIASNILGLIPQSHDGALQSLAQDELLAASERSFVLLVASATAEKGLAAAQALENALHDANLIPADDSAALPRQLANLYHPYRQQLLTTQQRHYLNHTDVQTIADAALAKLYSPVRSYSPYPFTDDPFNLAGGWQTALFGGADRFLPSAVPSVLDGEQHWYVLNGELYASPFDQAVQRSLTTLLREFTAPDVRILRSGLVFHAAEGADLAQSEISTVGAGSLLGIVLLVVLVFRSAWALWSILIVLGSSTLFAVTSCLLVFDNLHMVTLAFGSTLLGLAVDYCFHFFSKWRASGNALQARKLISKGVLLSLVSSAIAYLLQLMSPFPGLQQFAVFITAGLLMACFTVLIVLPLVLGNRVLAGPRLTGLFSSVVLPLYQRVATLRWPVICVLLTALLLAVAAVARQGASDDIRLLNTSGDTLLAEERAVSELTVRVGSQRFFIIQGDTKQEMLQATEQLSDSLWPQHKDDPGQADTSNSLFSIARFIPSLEQQRQDHLLVQEKIYGPGRALEILCQSLPDLCKQNAPAAADFLTTLVPERMPAQLQRALKLNAVLGDGFSLALPLADSLDPVVATQVAGTIDAVDYVDNVANITQLLAQLRVQVSALLIGFIACLTGASLWLFKRDGWLLITSLLLTVVYSLALSAAGGLTLFHVMALLLVMGLTVDTSIFYIKLGFNQDTWLAAALSCGTSLLAFGLLSFSQVAVLEQFGSVVFSGLIFAWLLTPLIFCLFQPRFQYAR
ncbi:MAG: MMPL family transporter [Pseudomonadales bacterium]